MPSLSVRKTTARIKSALRAIRAGFGSTAVMAATWLSIAKALARLPASVS